MYKDAGVIMTCDKPVKVTKISLKDLPVFQLRNSVRDKSKEVFSSVNDFLTKFEIVVRYHNSLPEDCWETAMLPTLSTEQLSWFQRHLVDKKMT